MDGHESIPEEKYGLFNHLHRRRVVLPLGDGSSISVRSSNAYRDGKIYEMRWVDIGGFTFIFTPKDCTLVDVGINVQLHIGNTTMLAELAKLDVNTYRRINLGLPEQKTVVDWARTSIEHRKLGESPIRLSILPKGQEPKS